MARSTVKTTATVKAESKTAESKTARRAGKSRSDQDLVALTGIVVERLRELKARLENLSDEPVADARGRRLIADANRLIESAERDSAVLLGAAVTSMTQNVRAGIAAALDPVDPDRLAPAASVRRAAKGRRAKSAAQPMASRSPARLLRIESQTL